MPKPDHETLNPAAFSDYLIKDVSEEAIIAGVLPMVYKLGQGRYSVERYQNGKQRGHFIAHLALFGIPGGANKPHKIEYVRLDWQSFVPPSTIPVLVPDLFGVIPNIFDPGNSGFRYLNARKDRLHQNWPLTYALSEGLASAENSSKVEVVHTPELAIASVTLPAAPDFLSQHTVRIMGSLEEVAMSAGVNGLINATVTEEADPFVDEYMRKVRLIFTYQDSQISAQS